MKIWSLQHVVNHGAWRVMRMAFKLSSGAKTEDSQIIDRNGMALWNVDRWRLFEKDSPS